MDTAGRTTGAWRRRPRRSKGGRQQGHGHHGSRSSVSFNTPLLQRKQLVSLRSKKRSWRGAWHSKMYHLLPSGKVVLFFVLMAPRTSWTFAWSCVL